jgi:hypothetical protein
MTFYQIELSSLEFEIFRKYGNWNLVRKKKKIFFHKKKLYTVRMSVSQNLQWAYTIDVKIIFGLGKICFKNFFIELNIEVTSATLGTQLLVISLDSFYSSLKTIEGSCSIISKYPILESQWTLECWSLTKKVIYFGKK